MLEDFGLIKALAWLAEDLQNTRGLNVDVQHQGQPGPLDERIRFTLFRAARELLINVVKHAGIDHATVTLENGEQGVRLTVEDRGNGFDPAKVSRGRRSGFGLLSILERLSYLGGEMQTESTPGKGSKIVLLAPLEFADRRVATR